MKDTRLAVVKGASSGIGSATARALAKNGFKVALGARRVDRVEAPGRIDVRPVRQGAVTLFVSEE